MIWLGFFFAIEKPDPKVGSVKAFRTTHGPNDSTDEDEINLIECDHYLDGGWFVNQITESQQSLLKSQVGSHIEKKKFLCPQADQSLAIQGGPHSTEFT